MESSAVDLSTYIRKPLAEAHVAHLRSLGEVVTCAPGETMMAFGAQNDAFFYILSGEAAAWNEVTGQRDGAATLGPSRFTGEIGFLTGGRAMLTNRALTAVTAIRVPRAALLPALADIPEMGDVIVTVFAAARHRRLIESGQAGLTLIGADTARTICRVKAPRTASPVAPIPSAAPRRWRWPGAAASPPTGAA